MPKIVGKGVTVVEHDGMKIEELAGNVVGTGGPAEPRK